MDTTLEKIKNYADQAHGEQLRKYTPERYIVHPVRVMETCRQHTDDLAVLAAALLHDVLEDTPVKEQEMLEFLLTVMPEQEAKRTLQLVLELTDVYVKEAYPQWNRKQRKAKELERLEQTSPDSQTIKYADILDNCREIVKYDRHFAGVFLKECKQNLWALNKGNTELYKKAQATVEEGLRMLRN